jgi:acetyl esterase/lipase
VWDGVVYACEAGYRPLLVDVHVPRATAVDQRAPLVIWVHGGAWAQGSRRHLAPNLDRHWLIERALLSGFAVALVDYRLTREAPFPAPVADLRAATRWLRAHADDFGLDAGRFALWGESAGAHLACMAVSCDRSLGDLLDDPEQQPEDRDQEHEVQAVVDWYGPSDLVELRKWRAAAPSGPGAGDACLPDPLSGSSWDEAAASPLTYVRAGLPPFLVAHGRDDHDVPVAQSRSYSDALANAGVDVEYAETDGGHIFEGAPVVRSMIERTLAFLRHRLAAARPALDPAVACVERRVRQADHPPVPGDKGPAPRRSGAVRDELCPLRPYPVAPVEETRIAGPGGDLSLSVQRPTVPTDVVMVYLPGRGWPRSDLPAQQGEVARIAASTPTTVVQVGYRLAPEHPFPAASDDAVAAVQWAAGHLHELGGTRLVLGGDGAGGNLATATAAHCRELGIHLSALLVLYALNDWALALVEGLPATYPDGRETGTNDPDVFPVAADLSGLPPTIVGVGALDSLLEDNLAFAYRLREAEVPVTLRVFPTLNHGFLGYATVSPAADRASEQICRDLSAVTWRL